MSVVDENRRTCKRCGKLINHWTDNLCDKNMCKIPEPDKHIDLKRGWYDVGEPCQQDPSVVVQMESIIPDKKPTNITDTGNSLSVDTKKMGLFDQLEKTIRQQIIDELFQKSYEKSEFLLENIKIGEIRSLDLIKKRLYFAEALKTAAKFLSDPEEDYS